MLKKKIEIYPFQFYNKSKRSRKKKAILNFFYDKSLCHLYVYLKGTQVEKSRVYIY